MIDFISNVGFPIVAFYLLYKQNNDVIEKCRDIIDRNTIAIEKLISKLDVKEIEESEDK